MCALPCFNTYLTPCRFVHILEEYQKLCIQIPDGNGGVLIPGHVPGSPDLPSIYPVPYPGQTPGQVPGQVPGVIPGQIPIQVPGHVPGQVPGQIPGQTPVQIPGQIPVPFPGQFPHLPLHPPPGRLLLSTCVWCTFFKVDVCNNSLQLILSGVTQWMCNARPPTGLVLPCSKSWF